MVKKLVLSAAILSFSIVSFAAKKRLTATAILNKVEKNLRSDDETADVTMKIIEKNGKSKDRNLVIKKKNKGKEQKVLVRLEKPTDIRGVGLLSVINNGDENQWLYLPSKKKSRRIISSNKKDSFLGSEFSYEDFAPSTYKHFNNKVLKTVKVKGKPCYLIESKAKKNGNTSYGRILTWVSKKDYRIMKSEYFDTTDKKLKVMNFKNYKKFGKNTWRAKTVEVKNVQNKRGTTLMLSELQLDSGLSDTEFTKRALEHY